VGRYIIGLASLISGDVEQAEQLLEDISNRINSWPLELPTVKIIKTRLPFRLAEVYEQHSRLLYLDWYTTRNKAKVQALEDRCKKLLTFRPDSYVGFITQAICCFVLRRDVGGALAEIKKCQKVKDCTWMYSKAFLLAYQGKVEEAKKTYWRAFKTPSTVSSTQIQVEVFLEEVIAEEPEKYYLYYFLGLINYHAKEDTVAALRDFQTFLDKVKDDHFPSLVEDARKYLAQRYAQPPAGL
jgi:tetratricopeptide (TPR) repeat protein